MKAIWNDAIIAESDHTIEIEGNHYFPTNSVKKEYLIESSTQTTCHWKGVASYHTLKVNNKQNKDAAWYYANPLKAASEIKIYIAFFNGF